MRNQNAQNVDRGGFQTQADLPRISLPASIELCRQIVAQYDPTFYTGSWLLPKHKRQAMWAIYAWFRQKDELVDDYQHSQVSQATLDLWFHQLEVLFSEEKIATLTDIALLDVIQRFGISIVPFRDMLLGQQMDLYKRRYQNWEEVKLYCYRVSGTVGLASAPILGSRAGQDATNGLVTLGIAMQLSNILMDVGSDLHRGRIYLPLDDLEQFNYSETDLLDRILDERWMRLMQFEIERNRSIYDEAAKGILALCQDSYFPLWLALNLYRQDLTVIERSQYQVFGDRPTCSTLSKLLVLPGQWWRDRPIKSSVG